MSVVIPIYNHEAYVGEALRSVIEQDHDDLELVCIDDGSTDGSIAVSQEVLSASGRRYTFVPQTNHGAHAALDRGASMASGELLMFLNSDDLYAPRRASRFVSMWEHTAKAPDVWGFSLAFFVDDDGAPADPLELGVGHLTHYTEWVRQEQWVNELFTWHNLMLTSGNLVVPHALYRQTGGFAAYRMVHDWDIALKLLAVSRPRIMPAELYGYRIHSSNTFRSIANEEAVNESEQVRKTYQAALRDRLSYEPYCQHGVPFLEYLRMSVPMKAGMSGW
ncbi:MAG: glycosyltransferase family A protein [Acidimicrobiales bacterium]